MTQFNLIIVYLLGFMMITWGIWCGSQLYGATKNIPLAIFNGIMNIIIAPISLFYACITHKIEITSLSCRKRNNDISKT